ncbi:hypothetical protein [Bacillus sp. 1P06AnD]|uniref:hypothetical protein n=1 Tax=Bacillus sp. 1P06AnD TaxID=3132208 RepID=UPI00399F7499
MNEFKKFSSPIVVQPIYNGYKPGMNLYFFADYKIYKAGDTALILFVLEKRRYSEGLYFVTEDGIKVIWNEANTGILIEENATTKFINSMYDYYTKQIETMKSQPDEYNWSQSDLDEFFEQRYELLEEMLLKYENDRINKLAITFSIHGVDKNSMAEYTFDDDHGHEKIYTTYEDALNMLETLKKTILHAEFKIISNISQ